MASLESPSPSSVSFPGTNGPYAIKTTSTAVLSRSNSISGRAQTPVLYSSSPNTKPLGRSQSRGHRHSRSLSNATSPLPLPVPPKRRESHGSLSLPPTPNEGSIAQLPVSNAAFYMLIAAEPLLGQPKGLVSKSTFSLSLFCFKSKRRWRDTGSSRQRYRRLCPQGEVGRSIIPQAHG